MNENTWRDIDSVATAMHPRYASIDRSQPIDRRVPIGQFAARFARYRVTKQERKRQHSGQLCQSEGEKDLSDLSRLLAPSLAMCPRL